MFVDRESLPGEMLFLLEPDFPIFRADVFMQFLQAELDRAARYSFALTLIVFELLPLSADSVEQRARLRDFALVLNSFLRSTDLLGSLEEGMLAAVAPHSSLETGARLVERLHREPSFAALRRRTGSQVNWALSVFPADTTTLSALVSGAVGRLRGESPT